MKAIRMRVVDVPENAVLAENVMWQRRKLIAKGSVLTRKILDLIRRRNIQYIYIMQESLEAAPTLEVKVQPLFEKDIAKLDSNINYKQNYTNQYLRALAELNTEVRYGRVFANERDVDHVRELFESIMEHEVYRNLLNELEQKDRATFLRAIDVFTLCVLLCASSVLNITSIIVSAFYCMILGNYICRQAY